jgi:hypothetical protein
VKRGTITGPPIAPGEKGFLTIPSPSELNAEVFYLTAFDWKGDTVCTWSWRLMSDKPFATYYSPHMPPPSSITTKENDQFLSVVCDGIAYDFDKSTGFLQKVVKGKKIISFHDGPALARSKMLLKEFRSYKQGFDYFVEPIYYGDSLKVKWTFHSVGLPKLEYSFLPKDTSDFFGITFNYPEEKITGVKYLGRGPYHVWKNRMKGQQLGVWQKAYNNTVTGESWNYPEFKGYYAEVYWMQLQTKEGNFLVLGGGGYLQLLKTEKPKAAGNDYTSPPFPEGNIGFMHAIPAIGTKFQAPELLGPQSQKNVWPKDARISGSLLFDFR